LFIAQKEIDKVVILRILVGDAVLNQNLNMALSHYGFNLKDLKAKLDLLTEDLPKGLYLYFYMIIFTNNTYDILLKSPTLSSCMLSVLSNVNTKNLNKDSTEDFFFLSLEDIIITFKTYTWLKSKIIDSVFYYNLLNEFKQLLGIISSFKTL